MDYRSGKAYVFIAVFLTWLEWDYFSLDPHSGWVFLGLIGNILLVWLVLEKLLDWLADLFTWMFR